MKSTLKVRLIAGATMVACLVGSTGLAGLLTSVAGRSKLVYTDRAEDGASAEVVAGIAMGAFRGIFVNFLWMRANELKEAGKYYEAVELARAITKLQPRFPRVWVFHAWNLAYNISVMTQTPEERWAWVNAGIRLLRDEGIPANPNDMLLHKELAWIFIHKIGGYTDDVNPYYKVRLAMEWTAVVGPPPAIPPEKRSRDGAIETYVNWIKPIADAPDSAQQLVSEHPEVRDLMRRIRETTGPVPNMVLLTRYEAWRALKNSGQRTLVQKQLPQELKDFGAIVDDPAMRKSWDVLLPFVRKQVILQDYHMDPDRMVRYIEKYGPIDWRHSAAHSLYWAATGVELASGRWTEANRKDFDFINTDRIVAQSVQELYRSGEVYFDYFAASMGQYALVQGMPSPYFVESYGNILDEIVELNWETEDRSRRGWTSMMNGYENFLKDAVTFFYLRGQVSEAEKWRGVLLNDPRMNVFHDPDRTRELSLPLNEFVEKELHDRATSPSVFVAQATAALDAAYVSGLLAGNQDLFLSQFEYAKRFHRYFMQEQRRITLANPNTARMDQWPPDFEFAAGNRFALLMQTLSLDEAEQMYERAPESLKQYAYDVLANHWKEGLDMAKSAGGRSFDEVFPEPAGMDAFHRDYQRKLTEWQDSANVKVEQK